MVGVFTAAALLSARNLVVASLVFLPGDGTGPRRHRFDARQTPGPGRRASWARSAWRPAASSPCVHARPAGPRPRRATRSSPWRTSRSTDIDTREVRLAAPDIVGNLVGYVYGPERRVFYDDRFDMFPEDVTEAHVALVQTRAVPAGATSTSSTSIW